MSAQVGAAPALFLQVKNAAAPQPIRDYAVSKAFYLRALAPLGVDLVMEFGTVGGFGRDGKPELWLGSIAGDRRAAAGETSHAARAIAPVHVAIAARSRDEVDAFYRAAIAAGGRDNGAPGPRPQYHAGYYGAFVLDPDGHNLEAVIHGR